MVQGIGRATGWVGLARKKAGRVTSQPVFASGKKKSGSGRVFFWSGQKILTPFAMSNLNHQLHKYTNFTDNSKLLICHSPKFVSSHRFLFNEYL